MARKLALLVGNSEYEDEKLHRLQAPPLDVEALAEVLRDPAIGAFEEVTPLVNAALDVVRRAISRLFRDRNPDDLVLLYFSGHGVRDVHGRLYLAVAGTQWDDPAATAVEAVWLRDRMDESRSRRQVLVLDCCHSGAFYEGSRDALNSPALTEQTFAPRGYGREVLTASTATQLAFEGDRLIGDNTCYRGTFTHYLIEGLRSGEAGGESDTVAVQQLFDYAAPRVTADDPRMQPKRWADWQSAPLVIARNPAPKPKPKELPPDLSAKIIDLDPVMRQGAVLELLRLAMGDDAGLAMTARQEIIARLRVERDMFVRSVLEDALARLTQQANGQGEDRAIEERRFVRDLLVESQAQARDELDMTRKRVQELEQALADAQCELDGVKSQFAELGNAYVRSRQELEVELQRQRTAGSDADMREPADAKSVSKNTHQKNAKYFERKTIALCLIFLIFVLLFIIINLGGGY